MTIALMRVKNMFSNCRAWFFLIGLPIIFSVIFGVLVGGGNDESKNRAAVGLIRDDLTNQAPFLYQSLTSSQQFTWVEGTREELIEQVQASSLIAAVEYKPSTEDQQIILWKKYESPEHIQLQALIRQRLQEQSSWDRIVQAVDVGEAEAVQLEEGLQERWNQLHLSVDYQPLSGLERAINSVSQASSAALGFSIMFLMMNVVSGAGVILSEKSQGTWSRLQMAPITAFHLYFGYGLGLFFVGWLQFSVLMLVSTFFFNVQWGNITSFILLTSLFLIAVIALGLFLSQLVKNFKQQQSIGSLIVIATSMLAGVFWSIEFVPQNMQTLALFTPQYWAFEGFKDAMFSGKTVVELSQNLFALLSFALIFYLGWMLLYQKSRLS
jgi:ABC-2 type transport system permease protein